MQQGYCDSPQTCVHVHAILLCWCFSQTDEKAMRWKDYQEMMSTGQRGTGIDHHTRQQIREQQAPPASSAMAALVPLHCSSVSTVGTSTVMTHHWLQLTEGVALLLH